MSDDTQQPIVVRRVNKGHGGHHGGAWKIAYADFVTAMMAFFLLLWLLGSTAEGDLQGIADFFQSPLKVSQRGGSGAGDSSSIIRGGGEDLSRKVGQVKRGETEPQRRTINLEAAPARRALEDDENATEMRERARLVNMKGRIEALIEASPNLRALRDQILIDITSEGLRIQIVDEQNRAMFDLACAERPAEPFEPVGAHRCQAVSGGRARVLQLGVVGQPRQCVTTRTDFGRTRPVQGCAGGRVVRHDSL